MGCFVQGWMDRISESSRFTAEELLSVKKAVELADFFFPVKVTLEMDCAVLYRALTSREYHSRAWKCHHILKDLTEITV